MTGITIPIIAVDSAQRACGGCVASEGGPVCRSALGEDCQASELCGPADEVQRVLRALASRLGFAVETPELGGVRRLVVAPGEVDLQLSVPAHCGGAALAEVAFETLRSLLPDTDIYVRPLAAA